MFSINTAKLVTKMPFKDCIYVLIRFTIYTLYCIPTYLEKFMTMSRYWAVSARSWWIDTKSINYDVRCKTLCSRPENVNAGKFAFSWEQHTVGVTHEELCSFSYESAGFVRVWPEFLSRAYRYLCGSGNPFEFKLKIFLLVYEQFLFENKPIKLGHIPIIGSYI